MIFETIETKGLAHFSYFIGDENSGECVVIDPRRDVEVYIRLAEKNGTEIKYIFETHIHADFISGSLELSDLTSAKIVAGKSSEYKFDHVSAKNGDKFSIGKYSFEVIHTPGHTPEHVCYLINGGKGSEKNWGLFTGDLLFAGEIGRPDLLGEGTEKKLAGKLFESIRNKISKLNSNIIIYPAHGKGSPCGASIGDRPTSTIGYEKENNFLLRIKRKEEFVKRVLDSQSRAPKYYSRMKKINAEGPQLINFMKEIPSLTVEEFKKKADKKKTLILDTREIEAFASAHIKGSLNIAARESFPVWAGHILNPEEKILLILNSQKDLDEIKSSLYRIGIEKIGGYLQKGFRSWLEAGEKYDSLTMLSVHKLKEKIDAQEEIRIIDVRKKDEYKSERIPTAENIFVPDLIERYNEFKEEKEIAIYCGSGFRASIAASILKKNGVKNIANIPGSISAWKAAGYPLKK